MQWYIMILFYARRELGTRKKENSNKNTYSIKNKKEAAEIYLTHNDEERRVGNLKSHIV